MELSFALLRAASAHQGRRFFVPQNDRLGDAAAADVIPVLMRQPCCQRNRPMRGCTISSYSSRISPVTAQANRPAVHASRIAASGCRSPSNSRIVFVSMTTVTDTDDSHDVRGCSLQRRRHRSPWHTPHPPHGPRIRADAGFRSPAKPGESTPTPRQ